jgi:hypothetical protein
MTFSLGDPDDVDEQVDEEQIAETDAVMDQNEESEKESVAR